MKTLFRAAQPLDQKKVILYVEDDPSNRQIAYNRLEKKYKVLLAGDDQKACDILTMGGQHLHVILMDIELKDSHLNGIELCKLIRGKLPTRSLPCYARDVKTSEIPIILVTAFATSYLKESFGEAGISWVIPKPVDFVELELAISSCLLQQVLAPHKGVTGQDREPPRR